MRVSIGLHNQCPIPVPTVGYLKPTDVPDVTLHLPKMTSWRNLGYGLVTRSARRAPGSSSVRIEFLQIADLAQGSSHLFDRLHLLECRLHGFSGRMHRRDGGLAGLLGGVPRFLTGGPCGLICRSRPLLVLANGFERFSLLVAKFACFLGEPPKALGFLASGFGIRLNGLCGASVLLGLPTAVLADLPHIFCLPAILLCARSAEFGRLTATLGRRAALR